MWISFMGNKHDVLRVWGSSYHGHGGMTPHPHPTHPPPTEIIVDETESISRSVLSKKFLPLGTLVDGNIS